jgi:hypothetical protein
MTRPAWFASDSADLVSTLLATAESCSTELACISHLRAAVQELATRDPSTQVDPMVHAAWRVVLSGVMVMMPVLVESAIVVPDGPRFYGGMIVLLESIMQRDPDYLKRTMAILNDTQDLATALRDLHASRAAVEQDRDREAVTAAAAVTYDPALVAELEVIDRLVVDEIALPLPLSAQRQAANNDRCIDFVAAGSARHIAALFRCWAQRERWAVETVLDDDTRQAFELRRDQHRIEVRIATWIHSRVSIAIEFPRSVTATVVRGHRSNVRPPPPPPITRERLAEVPAAGAESIDILDMPDAVLADGGLVFVSKDKNVWMIDPHARTTILVAASLDRTLRGLVADGPALVGFASLPVAQWRFEDATMLPLTTDSTYALSFTMIDGTSFVGCDDGRLLRASSTGAVAEIARFGKCRALTHVGGMLYVSDERLICAVNPATREVTTLLELPQAAHELASDGQDLYALFSSAIGRIDLATRAFVQIAGQPELGRGQMLDASKGAARDGVAEVAVIESARCLSYDHGALWFTDRGRLRFFDIAKRFVCTYDVSEHEKRRLGS